MDWNQIRKQGFVEVSGERYDIRHLRVFRFKFSIPAAGSKPEIIAQLEVKFSSHCVSLGPKKNKTFDFSSIGSDHRVIDGTGIERQFCPLRYEQSLKLRDIIRSLPTGRKCYFTGRDNWLTVEVTTADGVQQFYDIFFKLRRNGKNDLFMYLESAFVRNEGKVMPKRKSVGSKVLLGKTLRQEPIKSPP